MKKKNILYLFCLILPVVCFSQRGKKSNETSIYVSTSFNYYPGIAPYKFLSTFGGTIDDDLILNFITNNSGTFTIEEGQSIIIDRGNTSEFPSQLIGIGASVQFLKDNGLFHEISLTKLSFVKSSYHTELIYLDSLHEVIGRDYLGYKQNAAAFAFRYELGQYFGKRKSKLRFGISGGIEPSLYFYKRTSLSIHEYPMKANIYTIDLSIIPMLSAKLSKKITLDFKVISNILLGDFGTIIEQTPFASLDDQNGKRDYNLPEITMALSLALRYNLKEPDRKRR